MPPGTRRQPPPESDHYVDTDSEVEEVSGEEEEVDVEAEDVEEEEEEVEEEEDDGQGEIPEISPNPPPIPPNYKEISALASWTVTSAKPGCGIPQLRNSSTSLFWQSDGPQPHCLNIHFFKLVEICGMRIFLDFEQDESYTPTKIQFLAGMGYNDLQMFGEMAFEQPRGWIDVDFSGVGSGGASAPGSSSSQTGSDEEDDIVEDGEEHMELDDEGNAKPRKKGAVPILRAFLVQVKIVENHQNGKDTHLRGLQIFAKDKAAAPSTRRLRDEVVGQNSSRDSVKVPKRASFSRGLAMPQWSTVPELR